ncbi:hypothetical protein [Oceaniglobus indicus]|uniref:hypothetical protein n=1 Tax=Oceaniglobus indicus TaxID=2047749 RepID=UPI000C19B4D4|nr:hypothetical protein [Oceaniglobus indicus]
MDSVLNSFASLLDVTADGAARALTGSGGVGSAPLTLMVVLAVGMIAQPVFILCAMHLRPENPLKGKAGGTWIMAAGLIFYGGAVVTGRVGWIEHGIENRVVHPFMISVLGRDTCDPDGWAGCDVVFIDGSEIHIRHADRYTPARESVARPLPRPQVSAET